MQEIDNTADVLNEIEKDGREEIPSQPAEVAEPEVEVGEAEGEEATDSTEAEHAEKGTQTLRRLATEDSQSGSGARFLERASNFQAHRTRKRNCQGPAPDSSQPTPDQFNTYEEYVEAFTDWKAEQKFQQLSAKQKEEAEKSEIEERARETLETFNERLDSFREEHDDYNEIVGSIKLLQRLVMLSKIALLEDEHGPSLPTTSATPGYLEAHERDDAHQGISLSGTRLRAIVS